MTQKVVVKQDETNPVAALVLADSIIAIDASFKKVMNAGRC